MQIISGYLLVFSGSGLVCSDILCSFRLASSSRAQTRSAKLENEWSDPFGIANFLTKGTVQLANPDTGVLVKKAHVSHQKRYYVGD
ncbi:hypothetical protein B7P43_G08680 [Cryptotermes secundus]|uniref:Uncharacterized protein n=1 Tax=Cryptotermes secundus TaxID=105785 RepID=A0A2J7PCC5_9NEOP|nr:hypothetical protein B7P43_G08680 [Cryptotermes secundus]